MEKANLSSQESFEIIKRMITETRVKLENGGGDIFLIWGYTSLLVSIAVVLLLIYTGDPNANWVWWLIPIIGWSGTMIVNRNQKRDVSTYY